MQRFQVGEFSLLLRDVEAGDRDAVVGLHTLVFGPDVDGAWFDWKYGQGPAQGAGQAVGVWHADELIAYCGGVPRTLWRHGHAVRGLQIGDVMVHPQWRGMLTRRGPFFQVSRGFYDSRLGLADARSFQLGFGFPNDRHLRLAVLLGLWHEAGRIESLHWSVQSLPSFRLPWLWRWEELNPASPHFDACVNAAWRLMLGQCAGVTLGQRDAAYLRWRYVDRPQSVGPQACPGQRYRFYGLARPWSRFPLGVAVLGARGDSCHWLDWVGPVKWMAMACRACCAQSALANATDMMCWASTAVSSQLLNTSISHRAPRVSLIIPVASDVAAQAIPGLHGWMMGGDTDFL